jgi:elongation factor 1-beta
MATFDFSTPQAIGKFNGFLSDKSYLKGFVPTAEDAKVFADLTQHHPSGPEKKFAHVYRWYTHIASFSEHERQSWPADAAAALAAAAQPTSTSSSSSAAAAPAKEEEKKKKEEEVDFDEDDLFGGVSEEELAEQKKQREAAKPKKKKEEEIQKSNVILDVKPLEDTTDLVKLEELVRGITMEGLTWGPSKLVDVAYGIKKLQISCVIIDDLVYTEDLEEQITAFDEYVQSVDIAAFTKV